MLGRDADLDIRERAKTGIEQLGKLLGEGRASTTGYASPGSSAFGGGVGGSDGVGLGRLSGFHTHRHWGRDSGSGV